MRLILALVLSSSLTLAGAVAMHDRGECLDICDRIADQYLVAHQ